MSVVQRGVRSNRQVKKLNFERAKKEGTWAPKKIPEPPAPEWTRKGLGELPNGWTPPPESIPTNLAFAVLRSKSGNIPVYSKVKQNVWYTSVRHVIGDVDAFADELQRITDTPTRKRLGTVEIKGHQVNRVRRWLAHLGF